MKKFREYLKEQNNKLLSSLVDQDQNERNEYKDFVEKNANNDYQKGAVLWAKLKNRPADDVFGDKERFNKFKNTNFDHSTFSNKDWENYWVMSQHADHDREFQKHALGKIEQHLGKDNDMFKYLSDRIEMAERGTQTYGTQNN